MAAALCTKVLTIPAAEAVALEALAKQVQVLLTEAVTVVLVGSLT
jgi:hypothetical protein